jgi:hypothetical protein
MCQRSRNDALVCTLKPFVPETNASFGPHEIQLGAPHLFGATRSLFDDRAGQVRAPEVAN